MTAENIGFLLGSGVSRASGGPLVSDLTKSIIESPWMSHTDWRFYPSRPEDGLVSQGLAKRAQDLIRILHLQIEDHLRVRDRRSPNYEDYFSCLLQIVQDETEEITNPLIHENVARLRDALAHLHIGEDAHIDDNSFASLAERASDLIQCAVFHSLYPLRSPVGFDLIAQAAKALGSIDVFSLNHDLLIERSLDNQGIAFADGFGQDDGDARLFSWSWTDFNGPVRLYKLHGSVDWYLVRFESRGVDQFAKIKGDPDHAKDGSGQNLDSLSIVPSFLTGTTVKEQSYGISLYGEIFEQFRHRTRGCRTLICECSLDDISSRL